MKNLRHLFTVLLLLCGTVATAEAMADDGIVAGTTSDGLGWSYDLSTCELKISGSGDMHGYWETNDTHQWESYKSEIKKITISNGVTSIGSSAFEGCVSVEEVNIPNTITNIGKFAFYKCQSLKSIYIPESVETINDNAFSYCTQLTEVNIPESLKYLGQQVFNSLPFFQNHADGIVYLDNWAVGYKGDITNNESIIIMNGCIGLASYLLINNNCSEITLPSSLKYFGYNSIYNCNAKININCDLPDGCDLLGNKFTEIIIGNDVKYIGDAQLGNASLEKVVIGDNVERIGAGVFRFSENLSSVVMGQSVKIIGDQAFCQCSSLKSIELPQGLDSIGSQSFSGCTALENLVIPSSVTKLGQLIVNNNTHTLYINCNIYDSGLSNIFTCKAQKIVLGDGVQIIGKSAFSYCTELTEMVLPNSVTYIGDNAFSYCESLKRLKMSENLEHIGQFAFAGCNQLKEYTLPYSLKTIADYAFHGCSGTVVINCNLPDRDTYTNATFLGSNFSEFIIGDNVEYIGDYSLYYCNSMNSIIIPNSVKRIGAYAFSYCSNLQNISLGNGLECIGNNAFEYCDGLQRVDISDVNQWCEIDFENSLSNPVSLSNVSLYVGEELLTSLNIEEGVEKIKPYTFYNCKDIVDVNIPSSVTEICDYSFEGCRGLKNVYLDCAIPPLLGYDAFYNTTVENRGTLYIPAGTKSLYTETETWNYFRNIIEIQSTNIENVKTDKSKYNSTDITAIYDLQGREMKTENGKLKGVYIIDGKKVLVK